MSDALPRSGSEMKGSLVAYNEVETFDADLFFYDHDLAEYDMAKSPKQFACHFCGSPTERSEPGEWVYLFVCTSCGWWMVIKGGGGFGAKTCRTDRGLLKPCSLGALDVPLQVVRRFLCQHPEHVAHVNPALFERL